MADPRVVIEGEAKYRDGKKVRLRYASLMNEIGMQCFQKVLTLIDMIDD